MSLGGIAIAIGAMVDAAIVMIENVHKQIERWREAHPDREPTAAEHWALIGEASVQVGPALFFSLLIITLSFIPIFTLEAQEGRLFAPLAYTKTYAMAAAAGLAVTLVPVLMGYFIRGSIPPEERNPLNRWLVRAYRPLLDRVLVTSAHDDRRGRRAAWRSRRSRSCAWVGSSCRRSMKAICCTCRPRCPGSRRARLRSCCSRWIGCS